MFKDDSAEALLAWVDEAHFYRCDTPKCSNTSGGSARIAHEGVLVGSRIAGCGAGNPVVGSCGVLVLVDEAVAVGEVHVLDMC